MIFNKSVNEVANKYEKDKENLKNNFLKTLQNIGNSLKKDVEALTVVIDVAEEEKENKLIELGKIENLNKEEV